ncbi:MAG: hypothetical protein OIF50_09810, partial [Flavobacteriaceae bacterium]|nr:hypothetical protein [Flavobacteriaceae bacterium]
MQKQRKNILFSLLFGLGIFFGWTQNYPAQVQQTFYPPYQTKLSSYATSSNELLRVYLTMTDIQVANRQVRLQLKISGNGLQAQSNHFVIDASPVYLTGGTQTILTNLDLAPYFRLENLQGISAQQYSRSLPEGQYRICWEVYDFFTNQR